MTLLYLPRSHCDSTIPASDNSCCGCVAGIPCQIRDSMLQGRNSKNTQTGRLPRSREARHLDTRRPTSQRPQHPATPSPEISNKAMSPTLCVTLSIGFRASKPIKAHAAHSCIPDKPAVKRGLSAARISYRAARWWEKPQIAASPAEPLRTAV